MNGPKGFRTWRIIILAIIIWIVGIECEEFCIPKMAQICKTDFEDPGGILALARLVWTSWNQPWNWCDFLLSFSFFDDDSGLLRKVKN